MMCLGIKGFFLFLLGLYFTNLVTTDDNDAKCPCRIFFDEGKHNTECSHQQELTKIPECVPNNTQILAFGGNDLRYTPGQFQRFSALVDLNLAFNRQFAPHEDSFLSLYLLETLDLRYTDLSYLTGQIFLDQTNLKDLRIGFGNHEAFQVKQDIFTHVGNLRNLTLGVSQNLLIPAYAFDGLSNLKNLDLSKNYAITLNELSFHGLRSLRRLSLANQISKIVLPGEIFKALTNLEDLSVQGVCASSDAIFDCTTIDEQLQYLPSLKRLYMDKVLISNLGEGFLSLNHLEELYLTSSLTDQYCKAEYLNSKLFQYLQKGKLSKLSLDECFTMGIFPSTFSAFISLRILHLSIRTDATDTILMLFADGLKETNIHVLKLSLSGKPVYDSIPIIQGISHTNLTSLELTNTEYQSVDTEFIVHLPKSLVHLNLTRNCIERLHVRALTYLENLETIDLSDQLEYQGISPLIYSTNNVTKSNVNKSLEAFIPNGYNSTMGLCLGLPYTLKHLYLKKSSLLPEFIPAFCETNNTLKVLDLSHQRDISPFESRVFWNVLNHLRELEVLNLEGNKIDVITRESFTGLYKLRVLSFVDNKLIELSFNVGDLVSLEMLSLSYNSIGYATDSFTGQIEDIAWNSNITLNFDHNPLLCGCTERGFVAWLLYTKIISNKFDLNCTFENGTKVSVKRVSRIHLLLDSQCIQAEVTAGCIVIFFSQIVVLGFLAYIWHNRQKLRYLVLFGRRTLNPYHPIEDHEIEMEHDVYISFDGDFCVRPALTLRDFVYRRILPGLERRGVRVMIREELDAGRNMYEIITQTVRRSKKVLVFLSRNYCQDMWNVFEFNQAIMEGIYTNRQIAIPVLFQSIGPGDVKEEIYAFLRMEPVHRYSPKLSDKDFISFLCERINDTRQFG